MRAHLVLIGTGGNQRYIFSSTKRQEIVGASELITRVERQWADEAFEEVFPGFSRDGWRIEDNDAELLSAGAGGLTAVVRAGGRARALVTALTRRALAQAPGLDVCGVVTEDFTWDGKTELAEMIRKAHALEPGVRAGRPGPQSRFARLPIVDECSASGLPAAELRTPIGDERAQPRSAASVAKLDAYSDALVRLADDAGTDATTGEQRGQARRAMGEIVDYLGNEADWVAVVHADGNGLGEIFANLDRIARGERARDYADALRSFSRDVDECARRALRDAIGHLASRRATRMFDGLPAVLPLVFGGDDLTVVCDGPAALSFTRVYLERFAAHAAERVGGMLTDADPGRPLLGAAAGVAIVKRHYPFHFAYRLAEELMAKEAKQVKANLGADGCAMAFHVLYESSAPDLGRLRSHTLSDGARMVAQPYVVGVASEHPWARGRHWEDLKRRVGALKRRDASVGERLLPSGAVHELREGLFLGTGVARARHTLLERRFTSDRDRRHALADLGGFWPDVDGRTTTGLLDAMNAAEFFAGEELG